MAGLALRVLVTAAGIALPTLLGQVALPGIADEAWAAARTDGGAAHLSVGVLGVDGVLLAFVVVEIVAALVPRWRPLRRGKGRPALLRATFGVAAALVLAQGLFVAWSLRTFAWGLASQGLGPLLADAGAAALGTAALLAGARMVTRFGAGHGLSVVAVLGALPGWLQRADLGMGAADPEAFARTLVLATLASILILGREVRGERLPVPGLVPLLVPGWLMQLVAFAGTFVSLEALAWLFDPSLAAVLVVVCALALGLAWVGEADRSFARLRQRGAAIALSVLIPAAIIAGDRAIGWDASFFGAGTGLAFFVTAVACALDVLHEASLRSQTALVPVLAFSEIRVVDLVGARLTEADIPFVMRGALHRTVLRFFGPWVPVKLLVPPERAAEATLLARTEATREAYEEIVSAF